MMPPVGHLTRLLGAVALLALVAGCGTDLSTATAYRLERPEFSVGFPEEPTEASQDIVDIPGLVATTWTVETATYAQSVAVVDYPDDVPLADPAAVLAGARDGAVANIPGGSLTESSETTVDGRPAVDLVASVDGGTYRSRILLDDRRLYQLITAGSDDRQAEHEAFAGSLRLP
jgi:hypothetical protein